MRKRTIFILLALTLSSRAPLPAQEERAGTNSDEDDIIQMSRLPTRDEPDGTNSDDEDPIMQIPLLSIQETEALWEVRALSPDQRARAFMNAMIDLESATIKVVVDEVMGPRLSSDIERALDAYTRNRRRSPDSAISLLKSDLSRAIDEARDRGVNAHSPRIYESSEAASRMEALLRVLFDTEPRNSSSGEPVS